MSAGAAAVAKLVGSEVRGFVRDRFTPGDLASLDDLARFVEEKVTKAIEDTHGLFLCFECGAEVDVEKVRCRHCVDPTNTQVV